MEGILSIALNDMTLEALADEAVRVVVLRGTAADFDRELSLDVFQHLQQLPHHKRVPVIMLQRNTRTTYNTFQGIIGNMNG